VKAALISVMENEAAAVRRYLIEGIVPLASFFSPMIFRRKP
jgi:uncharacterized membrane protein (GlpM family)